MRQELVVGGWMPGEGSRSTTVGALLVGYYEPSDHGRPGPLRYVGRVGSGFNATELRRLRSELESLSTDVSPFGEGPLPRGARFVEPKLVAEVAFSQWTDSGTIRQPSFLGWRNDINPHEVLRQT